MKVEVQFQTQYVYEEPVSFSTHLYRLFPRAGRDVVIRRADFQTNAGSNTLFRRDLFDNEIASTFYPGKSALLAVNLQLSLEIGERNPFGFLLSRHAVDFPFQYTEDETRVLAPFLVPLSSAPELPFWKRPAQPRPTVEALVELNAGIREHFRYERREEGRAREPEETVALGLGACRDFAVLLAAVLRREGVAARLVSGYLVETSETDRHAEGALHAWTEAYLPGAGWLGFDPTNGILCNHHHIAAAIGLRPEDIAPTFGDYYHPHSVTSQMTSTLSLHESP